MNEITDTIWEDISCFIPSQTLELIGAAASIADIEGKIHQTSIDSLKACGYLKLAIPTQFEGLGANILQCCSVQRRIAEMDPALAIALNMHLFSVGVLYEHWKVHRDRSWVLLEAIATQNRIVASAFAEPGLNGSLLRSNCKGIKIKGGYVVTGMKSPCSLLRRSDLICMQFESDQEDIKLLHIALIPTSANGVRIETTWDSLGMRSSESDTLFLDECFIPDDLIFHNCTPGYDEDPVFIAGLSWFSLTATAVYLGVSKRAISTAKLVLHKSKITYLCQSRSSLSLYQSTFGELVIAFLNLESSCVNVARMFNEDSRNRMDLLPFALSVKDTAIEVCTKIVAESMELCGGGAYRTKDILSRLLRDVQAIRFHPPTRLASRQIIGKWALGFQFSYELYDSSLSVAKSEAME